MGAAFTSKNSSGRAQDVPRKWWLMIGLILAATLGALRIEGRNWWCACGGPWPVSNDAWGPHNSQHFVDPYSLTHVLHGVLFCWLLAVVTPALATWWRFFWALLLECAWEVLENSAMIIERYRGTTAALGYTGDSIANSLGDILACAAGFWLAGRLGVMRSAVFCAALELVLLTWIRDNLTLNVLMLAWPVESIRVWQTGA
jgi:hypothetical protein